MMISHTLSGVVGGLVGFAVLTSAVQPPDFLEVESIEQAGDQVIAERQVNYNGNADWRVTIIRPGGMDPICWTRPGPKPHQGWSPYEVSEPKVQQMHLDKWVGDPGCWDRLEKGQHYREIVVWNPWGNYDPIKHDRVFVR